MTVALAWPPPSHIVWNPSRPPVASSWFSRVVMMRTPLAPRGCPMAMAPPRGLNFVMSGTNSRAHMSAIDANASLHSMASKSSVLKPVRANSLRVTGLGADSVTTGSSASTAKCRSLARTGRPSRSAVSRLAISMAAAPSVICDELPAVMSGAVSGSQLWAGGDPRDGGADRPAAAARVRCQWRVRHRLDAARDRDVVDARHDARRYEMDRLLRRPALAVDGGGRHPPREARRDPGVARDVG